MNHINQQVSNGSIIHFEISQNYSFCGTHIPIEESKITKDKVNCGLCISMIDKAKNVNENEYVK